LNYSYLQYDGNEIDLPIDAVNIEHVSKYKTKGVIVVDSLTFHHKVKKLAVNYQRHYTLKQNKNSWPTRCFFFYVPPVFTKLCCTSTENIDLLAKTKRKPYDVSKVLLTTILTQFSYS
jgi:hypothetical protein